MARQPVDAQKAGLLILFMSAAASVVLWRVTSIPFGWAYLLSLNVGALFAMATDKLAARRSHMRIPERTLWGFAALGGGGGILIGMRVFRHKTKKASFQFYLSVVLVIQFLVVLGLYHR